jgi:hypothetical protein
MQKSRRHFSDVKRCLHHLVMKKTMSTSLIIWTPSVKRKWAPNSHWTGAVRALSSRHDAEDGLPSALRGRPGPVAGVHCSAGQRGHVDASEIKLLCTGENERTAKRLRQARAEIATGSPMLCRLRQLRGFVSAKSALAQFLAVAQMDPGLNFHALEWPHRPSAGPATASCGCLEAPACPNPGQGKRKFNRRILMKYLLMITAALALISTASAKPSRPAAAGCCNGGACCKAQSACCKK